MNKKDCINYGIDVAVEILTYGDFTSEELANEEKFIQAFWEIEANRRQYGGLLLEDFRRDQEWDWYEKGLEIGLNRYLKKKFK